MGGEPEGRGLGLARRLRASIEDRLAARRRAEEDQRQRVERARLARARLLVDLAAFGRALGPAQVTATEDLVVIRYDGHSLRFEAEGEADSVVVKGDRLAEGYRLQLNDELGRWALHPSLGSPRLLFDAGLEDLVVRVFGLRAVAGPVPAEPAPGREETSPAPGPTRSRQL